MKPSFYNSIHWARIILCRYLHFTSVQTSINDFFKRCEKNFSLFVHQCKNFYCTMYLQSTKVHLMISVEDFMYSIKKFIFHSMQALIMWLFWIRKWQLRNNCLLSCLQAQAAVVVHVAAPRCQAFFRKHYACLEDPFDLTPVNVQH